MKIWAPTLAQQNHTISKPQTLLLELKDPHTGRQGFLAEDLEKARFCCTMVGDPIFVLFKNKNAFETVFTGIHNN